MKSRSVSASAFKNSCLRLMEDVRKHGMPVTVTKRGKPLVRVVPVNAEAKARTLLGTIIFQAKDIFSTGERWEADG